MRLNPKLLILILVLIIISFAAGLFFKDLDSSPFQPEQISFNKMISKYPFLSKRILQEDQNDYLINFLSLRRQLHQAIAQFENKFAMYFEYLPSGTSIGVNDKFEFSAASLIKVPIVMAYYHYKERLGIKEDPTVTIEAEQLDDGDGQLWTRGAGAKVNLAEAVKLALIDSDNTAAIVIARTVPQQDFAAVYEGLDIDLYEEGNEVIITAKHYSSVLKALYFSSVLSKENSNHILELLSTTTPRDKITLGVPDDIKISNKIGILAEALYQDCGIVYVPKRPYALCLISKSDERLATERMKTISEIVYKYVSSVNKSD